MINTEKPFLKPISAEITALIPKDQLLFTKQNILSYQDCIKNLESQLQKCPDIGETDSMKEHPAIFHYFYGSTDIFICEYDRNNRMFGYAILGGDLDSFECGYFNLSDLTGIPRLNIDYHFEEQSIEAALHKAYPKHFKKPLYGII